MKLSKSQRDVVKSQDNVFISACPGAGKTRVVAAKVIREIRDVIEASREMACITYTNAARREISERLEKALPHDYMDYVSVNTLHGFLLENILRPWAYLLPQFSKGIKLVSQGDPSFEESVADAADSTNLPLDELRRSVKHYWRDRNGRPIGENAIEIAAFIDELEKRGCTDFAGTVFHSFSLLESHEFIRTAIGFRFSWLLVDEYQDFNPTALGCFSGIARSGATKLFLIGDLGQIIFSFNGVDSRALKDCVREVKALEQTLSETYRCGPQISAAASRLRSGTLEPVEPASSLKDFLGWDQSDVGSLLVDFVKLCEKELIPPERCALLATTWDPLVSASSVLTRAGYRVVVPQDRNSEWWFFGLLTRICAMARGTGLHGVLSFRNDLADALTLLGLADRMWTSITDLQMLEFAFKVRESLVMESNLKKQAKIIVPLILDLLSSAKVLAKDDRDTFLESCRGEWRELSSRRPQVLEIACRDLAEQKEPLESIRCLTIHAAKGLEFDAVALINCGEGRLPFYNKYTPGDPEEDRRKFFVALTRARRIFVALAIGKPSRYISEAQLPNGLLRDL